MTELTKKQIFDRNKKRRAKTDILNRVTLELCNYIDNRTLDINVIKEFYKDDYSFMSGGKEFKSFPEDNRMIFDVLKFYSTSNKIKDKIISLKVKQYDNADIVTNCYCIVMNMVSPECCQNTKKKFISYEKGLGFCGTGGKCKSKDDYMSQKLRNKTTSEIDVIVDKRKKTSLERYGVDNPSKSPDIIDKIMNSQIEKYGSWYTQTEDYFNKVRETSIEKYGIDHFTKSEEIKKLRKKGVSDKHGEDVINIFQTEETKNKIKSTNLTKYGNESYQRLHYSSEIIDILSSKERLEEELNIKSVFTISEENKIHWSTIYRYIKKYNINRPVSSGETTIKTILDSIKCVYHQNTRKIIPPMELDFYIPEYNLAIEVNGLYWHSDIFKDKNYHLNKYNLCKEKGIRLISINEDELCKIEIIKSKILSILGESKKGLPARKLSVKEITSKEANEFCERYHIQGKTSAIIYSVGAYDSNKLIGVMLFSKQRTTGDIELIRFCHDGDIHSGLFSKMLKYSLGNNKSWSKIISFADLRYSEGDLYEKTGFIKEKVIGPDYKYIRNGKTFHKTNFKKDNIKNKFNISEEEINSKTEKEIMEELGFCRIYDIGKIKYVLVKDKMIFRKNINM